MRGGAYDAFFATGGFESLATAARTTLLMVSRITVTRIFGAMSTSISDDATCFRPCW